MLKINNKNTSCSSVFNVNFEHISYLYVIMSRTLSTLYTRLNIKELLARNRRDIWSLSNSYEIWTHNHLIRRRYI